MERFVRAFLLTELHGWEHETALVSCLEQRPALCRQLGFETIPDQSTPWRTLHRRFSADLREAIQRSARTILIRAERAQAKRPLKRDEDRFVTDRRLHLGNNEWLPTTMVYKRKEGSDRTDYGQCVAFMTNKSTESTREYSSRWEIESGYKRIERFIAATTSKSFVLRFSTPCSRAGYTQRGELSTHSFKSS